LPPRLRRHATLVQAPKRRPEHVALLLRGAQHAVLEHLRDREADLASSRDLDRLARLRIAAHAGLHLAQAENPETRDLQGLALLDRLARGVHQGQQHLVRLLLRDVGRFSELSEKFRFRHYAPPPRTEKRFLSTGRAVLRKRSASVKAIHPSNARKLAPRAG